jgi:ribonuclease BN (tRNA processing enzyme)
VRVVVLGGSAAGVSPGAGCSGYLVEHGDTRVLIDLGPGTLLELRKHTEIRTLTAIVISHWHLDHVLDLGALRYTLKYNPVQAERKVPLYLPPGCAGSLAQFASAFAAGEDPSSFFPGVFDVQVFVPARELVVGKLTLRFTPTRHYVPCWAIRISNGEAAADLSYSADTGPAVDLAGFAQGSAVLIAESALRAPGAEPFETRGHLTAFEAGELAARAGVGRLIVTHNWHELDPQQAAVDARERFSGQVDLARPGFQARW